MLMDSEVLKNTIQKRISEHSFEVKTANDKLEAEKQKITQNKKGLPDLQTLNQVGILKDKIVFHKACIMTLNDILETIVKSEKD